MILCVKGKTWVLSYQSHHQPVHGLRYVNKDQS